MKFLCIQVLPAQWYNCLYQRLKCNCQRIVEVNWFPAGQRRLRRPGLFPVVADAVAAGVFKYIAADGTGAADVSAKSAKPATGCFPPYELPPRKGYRRARLCVLGKELKSGFQGAGLPVDVIKAASCIGRPVNERKEPPMYNVLPALPVP
jgi:hypothetical protein